MFKGILFDLDGTLLRIDLEAFLSEYFSALGPVLASVMNMGANADVTAEEALAAVIASTDAMCRPHPGATNRDVFNETFQAHTGVSLDAEQAITRISQFYTSEFPALQRGHGPRDGAREAFETARARGLRIVLATNPIFPREAIVERLRWAGFTPDEFYAITSYEQMTACKPMPAYYRQAAGLGGLQPSECLMVGDDPVLDAAAADVGMRVFYVGSSPAPPVDWAGSMQDLRSLLERIETSGPPSA